MSKHKTKIFSKKINGISILCIIAFGILSCSSSKTAKSKDSVLINEMVSKIKTQVDSQYVYKYEKTKFVPADGKTLLIQGQTVEGINDYMKGFRNERMPGGWSGYWAITEFVGVTEAYKNITGSTQHNQLLIDRFPNTALHSAMWMVGKWDIAKNTIKGQYDNVIKQYCDWVKTVNRPVYLRLGYEFDGPHNVLEPKEYVEAYKHIVDFMRAEGVNNVAYVWHSYASKPYKDYPVTDWYPGDDYVDWMAVSVFYQPYADIENHKETNDVLDFAILRKKPIMLAEVSPIFGIEKSDPKVWDSWFVNFFNFCYSKNIKAISFINEDWGSLTFEGVTDWKDARLNNNEKISKAWFKETDKERYLKQSPTLFEQLGYSNE